MAEKTNSVYELPIEEFEQRVLGLPPEKQRQEYQKWTQTQEKKQGGTNPLDFSFDQFEAYIAETNPSPQQQRFLYRKWMDKNTAGGRLKPKDKLPEGRERAEFLPVSKPEGKSVWEAGKSGELGWATPSSVMETGQAAGQALGTTEQLAKGRQAPVEDVEQAAWMGAGAAAGGSTAFRTPEGSTRTFGGFTQAKNPGTDLADRQQPLSYGEDGRLRFEIDDSQAVFNAEDVPVNQSPVKSVASTNGKTRLLDKVFKHDELYSQYPDLKDIQITFDASMERGHMGTFYEGDNLVVLNPNLKKNPDRMVAVLLHEIQHGIQDIEGFGQGDNSQSPEVIQRVREVKKDPKNLEVREDYENSMIDYILDAQDKLSGNNFKSKTQTAQSFIEDLRGNLPNLDTRTDWDLSFASKRLSEIADQKFSDTYSLLETPGKVDYALEKLAITSEKAGMQDRFKEVFGALPEQFIENSKNYDYSLTENFLGLSPEPKDRSYGRSTLADASKAYRAKAGETEARNVEARMLMNWADRHRVSPEETSSSSWDSWVGEGVLNTDELEMLEAKIFSDYNQTYPQAPRIDLSEGSDTIDLESADFMELD